MQKLTKLRSKAAPLLENAVDTDVIFPARFLLLLDREGLGKYAFNERRRGAEPFILDMPAYQGAEILVAGENFGTGSSREQAVWALSDLGIRCVIARSFGEIFFANCVKNGILPIVLDDADFSAVETAARAVEEIAIDLESQRIELDGGKIIAFDIEEHRKRALLTGLDEIGMILTEEADALDAFEARCWQTSPWLRIEPTLFEKVATGEDAA